MNELISWILAIFAGIGGLDYLLGDRLGFGTKFERALQLMGSMALSITGIIVMIPLLSLGMQKTIAPLFSAVGFDPGVLGLIPMDWGGFFLARDLALNPGLGFYGGICVAGTFGPVLSVIIPMGMQALKDKEKQDSFIRGILEALVIMPVILILGGLVSGLSFLVLIWHSLPILAFSGLVLLGIWKNLPKMMNIFSFYSKALRAFGILGITIGAFQQMSGMQLIPIVNPILDAFRIISMITVTMLGCLPLSEFLTRLLRKPFSVLADKIKTTPEALSNLIMATASGPAAIIGMQDLDQRGIELNASFISFAISGLAAQLAFILNNAPEHMSTYMVTKFVGGFLSFFFSIWLMNRREKRNRLETGDM